jgi:hypothetical protein
MAGPCAMPKKDGIDFLSVDTGKPKRLVAAGAE